MRSIGFGLYYSLGGVLFFLIVTRFGLLAAMIAFVVEGVLESVPITLDVTAWYASGGFWALGIVAVVAVYGFVISLGGRPLFGKGVIGDE